MICTRHYFHYPAWSYWKAEIQYIIELYTKMAQLAKVWLNILNVSKLKCAFFICHFRTKGASINYAHSAHLSSAGCDLIKSLIIGGLWQNGFKRDPRRKNVIFEWEWTNMKLLKPYWPQTTSKSQFRIGYAPSKIGRASLKLICRLY